MLVSLCWLLAYCGCLLLSEFTSIEVEASASLSLPTSIDPGQCKLITATNNDTALCQSPYDTVITGAAVCPRTANANSTHLWLSKSQPLPSMRGWRAECVDVDLRTMVTPSTVSAHCCSTTAFASVSSTSVATPSFQGCVSMSSTYPSASGFGDTGISGDVSLLASCSTEQPLIVSGGGSCPSGSVMTSSYSTNSSSWRITCSFMQSTHTLLQFFTSTIICCQSLAEEQCQSTIIPAQTSGRASLAALASPNALPLPAGIAYCEDDSSVLLNIGYFLLSGASDDSSVTRIYQNGMPQQFLFYGYSHLMSYLSITDYGQKTIATGLAIDNLFLSFTCCSMLLQPANWTDDFCPPLHPSVANGIGSITSSSPLNPFAFNSSFQLDCGASGLFFPVGTTTITCLSNGEWSHQGELGRCVMMDQSGCIQVTSSFPGRTSINASTLSCASAGIDPSQKYVMVNGGGVCDMEVMNGQGQLSMAASYPSSLSEWTAYCYDNSSGQFSPAQVLQAVCCPVSSSMSFFSTCRFQLNATDCGQDELVLSRNGQR